MSADEIGIGDTVTVSAELTNRGSIVTGEVAQLTVRDLADNVTRPARELKGFRRVRLKLGKRPLLISNCMLTIWRFMDVLCN
jgi:beta-glucosidase